MAEVIWSKKANRIQISALWDIRREPATQADNTK